MSSKKQYRIAVIPGDGIGKEVMPEGLRVIETAAKKHGVAVQFDKGGKCLTWVTIAWACPRTGRLSPLHADHESEFAPDSAAGGRWIQTFGPRARRAPSQSIRSCSCGG